MPSFTIVIPVWKTGFFKQALDSALIQNVPDLDILVLDDHSPEDVAGIVKQAADSRIHYIRLEENLGRNDPSRTWNKGLDLARGEFIVILGDDDLLANNYLQEMTLLITRHPETDLCRARLQVIGAEGTLLQVSPEHPEVETWDKFLYSRNQYRHPMSTSEMCARVNTLRALGGYVSKPLALGSDDLTWLALTLRHPLVSTNAAYACWRIHPDSICGAIDQPELRIRAIEETRDALLKIIDDASPMEIPHELLRKAVRHSCAINLHYIRHHMIASTKTRKLMRLLISLFVPSFFENKIRTWFHSKQG